MGVGGARPGTARVHTVIMQATVFIHNTPTISTGLMTVSFIDSPFTTKAAYDAWCALPGPEQAAALEKAKIDAQNWAASDHTLPARARELGVWPLDAANAELLDAVRPRNWRDPSSADVVYDLLVIGAGAGGLISSKQSARRGARSCMISEHLAGGDCLNVGCVPSKALLHCARVARDARNAITEGFLRGEPLAVDFGAVMARMRRLRAKIAPADAHDGTVGAGADVYQGRGVFVGPNTVEVNGQRLRFKKAVIATGGRATVPAAATTPGLADAPYVTNATLYNLTELPTRMVVIGAGVIAMEMAQAFAAFGTQVTVLVRSRIMARDEPAAAEAVQRALERDGVRFVFGAELRRVTTLRQPEVVPATAGAPPGALSLPLMRLSVWSRQAGGAATSFECECDTLLLATGRTPNVEGLGLEAAGVAYDLKEGVQIDDFGATTNPSVFAVGDCAAGVPRFTHMSGEMAKAVVQNALFGERWAISSMVVPRCAYTHPEVAAVGLTKADAARRGLTLDTYSASLAHNDRVLLEGDDNLGGFVEVHCEQGSDTIVGATVVAPNAGNIINELSLAIQAQLGLGVLARVIHPYPTVGEGVMQAGLGYIRKHWATLG